MENYPIKKTTLSFTAIKEFAESPCSLLHYWNKERDEPTYDMQLGKVFEMLFLRPNEFSKYFQLRDSIDISQKLEKYAIWYSEMMPEPTRMISLAQNKAWIAEFEAAAIAKGKVAIRNTDLEKIENRLRDEVEAENTASGITYIKDTLYYAALGMCTAASSYSPSNLGISHDNFVKFDDFDIFGVKFRGEADSLEKSPHVITDLKKVPNAHPKYLERLILERKWHWQAYIYSKAFDTRTVLYLCVEGKAPYNHFRFQFSEKHLLLAEQEIRVQCERFKIWIEKGYPENSYNFHLEGTPRNYILPLSKWQENTLDLSEEVENA